MNLKCPICDIESTELNRSPFLVTRDVGEGNVLESSEKCLNCWLYYYVFTYGNTAERIGFGVWEWVYPPMSYVSYDFVIKEGKRDAERKAMTEEVRRLWNHPDFRSNWLGGWKDLYIHTPPETGRLLIICDWLADNGFPLSEAALRKDCEEDDLPPAEEIKDPKSDVTLRRIDG
jgi:hypothetical protein